MLLTRSFAKSLEACSSLWFDCYRISWFFLAGDSQKTYHFLGLTLNDIIVGNKGVVSISLNPCAINSKNYGPIMSSSLSLLLA